MSPLLAYDGASPFSLAAAKRAGAVLITGYIVGHPGGFDPIDRARVERIHELGMGFLPNWERGAGYLVTCSRADGAAAGREALAACRALEVPSDGTIACPFSWDVAVHPSQYPHCGAVADGIIEGLGGHYLFTAYGQGGLIDYFARTGRLQSEGWLSASTSFPGYDASSPRVALVQRVGSPVAGTDQNVLTDPRNVHAWWPAGHRFDPSGEFTMDADAAARIDKLEADVAARLDKLEASIKTAINAQGWVSSRDGKRHAPDTVIRYAFHDLGADPDAIAKAVAAAMAPSSPGGLTAADVEAAVRKVFASAGATP